MREELQRELSALKAEQERQVARMEQTFQAEKLALQRSLASSAERISAVESRRQQIDSELSRTRMARQTAAGELEAELQKKEQELRTLRDELENERAGLACLSIAVPEDEIRILNGNHTQQARIP
ncbi:hypothetical protein F0U63_25460 [Cystobacter fuscus]|nr:hypothetical protein F0U63_25460 [Cystobacter fuscus]